MLQVRGDMGAHMLGGGVGLGDGGVVGDGLVVSGHGGEMVGVLDGVEGVAVGEDGLGSGDRLDEGRGSSLNLNLGLLDDDRRGGHGDGGLEGGLGIDDGGGVVVDLGRGDDSLSDGVDMSVTVVVLGESLEVDVPPASLGGNERSGRKMDRPGGSTLVDVGLHNDATSAKGKESRKANLENIIHHLYGASTFLKYFCFTYQDLHGVTL